jgi:hypothetical protein
VTMMIKTIRFDQEEKYISDFLKLPKLLYSKQTIVQNEKEEKDLLLGTHVLSKYFTLTKFLCYQDEQIAARCIVTVYPGDTTAYAGFFECVDDTACSGALFDEVKQFAAENGFTIIVGPVDASFWIKYRLKVNKFEKRPYVSEPYNKEYYLKLFLAGGFSVFEEYASNTYNRQPLFGYKNQKSEERYKRFTGKEYKIITPSLKDWDKTIRGIYKLLTELYSDFPIYKNIDEVDFVKHFENFKYILDLSMVKMAYYNDEAVGFFIGTPDYRNTLYGKITLLTYLKVFFKKIRSSNYIMLYMGVSKKHKGLGLAMIHTIIKNVNKKHATAVGALIKEGKITGKYGSDGIESKYKYVLLKFDLSK